MFPLYFCLYLIIDVSYFLIETLISIMRERRNEADDVSEKALKRMIKKLIRQLRQENVSVKTTNRIVRRYMSQIRRRRRNARHRHRNLAQSHLTETNTNKDLITDGNVLVSDPDLPNTNTDHFLNLTTDSPNTELDNVLNTLPLDIPRYQDDVTAAAHLARVFHTMWAAVHTCLQHQRSIDYPRRYREHGLKEGMEVVLYQPLHFHGLTFDLTLACDVARRYNSISARPMYFDYQRVTNIKIPSELVAGIDKDVKIIADETADGDKSCERTLSLQRCQQQTDLPELTTVLQREENDQCSQAFLYDEDFTGPKIYAPSHELIKWEESNDVTDCDLDLYQGEGWEATEMLTTNEANFGYRTTFDEAMHEYTTVLVKDDSPEWRQRWERACRLAEEIEAAKRVERENQAKLPKKRKRKQRRTKIAQNV